MSGCCTKPTKTLKKIDKFDYHWGTEDSYMLTLVRNGGDFATNFLPRQILEEPLVPEVIDTKSKTPGCVVTINYTKFVAQMRWGDSFIKHLSLKKTSFSFVQDMQTS